MVWDGKEPPSNCVPALSDGVWVIVWRGLRLTCLPGSPGVECTCSFACPPVCRCLPACLPSIHHRREMGGVIAQHQEPKEGAAPVQYSELNVSGFKEQLWVCLRRNFTIYNRAPGELAARDCDGGEAAGRGNGLCACMGRQSSHRGRRLRLHLAVATPPSAHSLPL